MKSAIVEREAGNNTGQRQLLEEGLRKFPSKYCNEYAFFFCIQVLTSHCFSTLVHSHTTYCLV